MVVKAADVFAIAVHFSQHFFVLIT